MPRTARSLPVGPLLVTGVLLAGGLAYWSWSRSAERGVARPVAGTVRVVGWDVSDSAFTDADLGAIAGALRPLSPHSVALTGRFDRAAADRLVQTLGDGWVGESVSVSDSAGRSVAIFSDTRAGAVDRAIVPLSGERQALATEVHAADGLIRVVSLGGGLDDQGAWAGHLLDWLNRRSAGLTVVVAPPSTASADDPRMTARFQRVAYRGDAAGPAVYVAPKSAIIADARLATPSTTAAFAHPILLVDVRRH